MGRTSQEQGSCSPKKSDRPAADHLWRRIIYGISMQDLETMLVHLQAARAVVQGWTGTTADGDSWAGRGKDVRTDKPAASAASKQAAFAAALEQSKQGGTVEQSGQGSAAQQPGEAAAAVQRSGQDGSAEGSSNRTREFTATKLHRQTNPEKRPFPRTACPGPEEVRSVEVTAGGIIPNASPPTKLTQREKSNPNVGHFPNVAYLAVDLHDLLDRGDYVPMKDLPPAGPALDALLAQLLQFPERLPAVVKQRTALWHQCRQRQITASRLGFLLGFSEPEAASKLGLKSSHWNDHSKTLSCFKGIREGGIEAGEAQAMTWGILHETNCQMLVLQHFKSISHLTQCKEVKLFECGIYPLLPPRMPATLQQVPQVPLMMASPDGLLRCKMHNDSIYHVLLEFKTSFPFKPLDTRDGFKYEEPLAEPKGVTPHHYAHCQLQMLAASVPTSLLVVYGPAKSKVFRVDYDEAWCLRMLNLVSLVNKTYLQPAAPQVPARNFCTSELNINPAWYDEFLEMTKNACKTIADNGCTVDSVSGSDRRKFLNKT